MKKVLLTGSAGFIGFHLVKKLLDLGFAVIGVDSLNDYYDTSLKLDRLDELNTFIKNRNVEYQFLKVDISDEKEVTALFEKYNFDIVINLAAQAGVRYSLENPQSYALSNMVGFTNIIESSSKANLEHFIFASSSSVYGMNIKQPFTVSDNTDFPVSLYAASKKANELIAHSYSHLYQMPCTGLRFFTVYGPFGRPDMAYYSFTKAIDQGIPINVFNNGEMLRDFTYIDDIVDGISKIVQKKPKLIKNNISNANAPFRVFNIGNNNPVTLKRFIEAIETALSKGAIKNMLPMQKGDVFMTLANIKLLKKITGSTPNTNYKKGVRKFVEWYLKYNKNKKK